MEFERYLESPIVMGSRTVAAKDVADAFEAQMQDLYVKHKLLDTVDLERLERLRVWDEESSNWQLIEQVGSSLGSVLSTARHDEAQKLQHAKHMMQSYYERILEGEAMRNEMIEKHKAMSKAKMATLLGDDHSTH